MAELTQDEKSQQLYIIKEEIDKYTAHDNKCRIMYDEQRKSEDGKGDAPDYSSCEPALSGIRFLIRWVKSLRD